MDNNDIIEVNITENEVKMMCEIIAACNKNGLIETSAMVPVGLLHAKLSTIIASNTNKEELLMED